MSFRTHLSVAGFGLAAVYAVLGLVQLVVAGDGRTALVFWVSALVTAALIAVLLPLLAPRRGDSDDDDDGGSGGGGDEPTPPPWWPQFEREFWSHVNRRGDGPRRRGPRERAPL